MPNKDNSTEKKHSKKISGIPHLPFLIIISIVIIGVISFMVISIMKTKSSTDDSGQHANTVTENEYKDLQYNIVMKRMSWNDSEQETSANQENKRSNSYYFTAINEEKKEKYTAYFTDYWPDENKNGKKDTVKVTRRSVSDQELKEAKDNFYNEPESKSFKELIDQYAKDGYDYTTE